MRTRIVCLPLVIVCILLDSSQLRAQAAHISLYTYFSRLPASPGFPSQALLSKEAPATFEQYAELDAIENNIVAAVKDNGVHEAVLSGIDEESATKAEAISYENEKPEMKQAHDALAAALKKMQQVRTQYQENFRRLEDTYAKRAGTTKASLIQANRIKIEGEAYLLSVYLAHIKPTFKDIDDLFDHYHYGDAAVSIETKNLFRGAQQSQLQVLTEIIERMKLEHITISNCARIAQQK